MSPSDHHKGRARRRFLKAAGVSIALPWLPSTPQARAGGRSSANSPMRMVCVGNEFGFYPQAFWPDGTSEDWKPSPLLKPLAGRRDDLTLFSHLDHGLSGGHFAVHTFLTGVKAVEARGAPDRGVSLDQRAAEQVGSETRFPSLTIGSMDGLHGGCRMSWTRSGARVPPIPGPRDLFRRLFVNQDAAARRAASRRIQLQESILDAVLSDANTLHRTLNTEDRRKLDEYLSSVRDVESQLALDRQWSRVGKPKPPFDEPRDEGLTKDLPLIYELMALALQTDSTRVATLEIGGSFAARDLGVRQGYHALSHHGQVRNKIDLLLKIEAYQLDHFARFLERLADLREPESGARLLDRTMVLFGSGMGNANSHTNKDLPLILAGGGFRHGRRLRYPTEPTRRVPLCNLYVSMLQRFGVETDRFSTATGSLRGLETIG